MAVNSTLIKLHEFTTLTSSSTGTTTQGLTRWSFATFYVNVSSGTGSLLCFLDTSLDGTGFVNVLQTNVILTAGVQGKQVATIPRVQNYNLTNITANAGPGTVRNFGLGDAVRVRIGSTGTFNGEAWVRLYNEF